MRSSWVRVDPKPMIGIFIRRENRPLCTVYGNEKWRSHCGKEFGTSQNVKHKRAFWPRNCAPGYTVGSPYQWNLHPWIWRADCNIFGFSYPRGWWDDGGPGTNQLIGWLYTQSNWKQIFKQRHECSLAGLIHTSQKIKKAEITQMSINWWTNKHNLLYWYNRLLSSHKRNEGEFLGGLVVRTLCFHCRGHELNSWSRN